MPGDWSSDVCSSDLVISRAKCPGRSGPPRRGARRSGFLWWAFQALLSIFCTGARSSQSPPAGKAHRPGAFRWRQGCTGPGRGRGGVGTLPLSWRFGAMYYDSRAQASRLPRFVYYVPAFAPPPVLAIFERSRAILSQNERGFTGKLRDSVKSWGRLARAGPGRLLSKGRRVWLWSRAAAPPGLTLDQSREPVAAHSAPAGS